MKKIILISLLLVASAAFGQVSVQQCWVNNVLSSGTQNQRVNAANLGGSTSAVAVFGFPIYEPCYTSNFAFLQISHDTAASSGTDKFTFGIYCISGGCTPGKLYVTSGELAAATAFPTDHDGAVVALTWTQSNVVLPAGLYGIAVGLNGCTSTTLCPIIAAETSGGAIYPFIATNAIAYSSGLPSTLSPLPTVTPTNNQVSGILSEPQFLIF